VLVSVTVSVTSVGDECDECQWRVSVTVTF